MFFLHHCLIGSSNSRVFLLDLDTERRKNIVLGLSACHLFPDDATEERWGTALSSPLTNCLLTIFLRGLKWEEEEDTEESLVGSVVTCHTDMRPVGKVLVDGRTMAASTSGELLDAGTKVRIIGLRGSELLVRAISP